MRRKLLFIILSLLLSVGRAVAIPVTPSVLQVVQPDGSRLAIRLHGDEYLSFSTTADGYSVVKDERGYYVYAQLQGGQLKPTGRVAHNENQRSPAEETWLSQLGKMQTPQMSAAMSAMRQQEQQARQQACSRRSVARRAPSTENFCGLVLLVEFKDTRFTRSDYTDLMEDMLNKKGYTGYDETGSGKFTGSVYDYFHDNSNQQFSPQFVVVPPILIDYKSTDAHGSSDVWKMVRDAVVDADLLVDYKKYDNDNDGKVDLVYVVFAGQGRHTTGNDDLVHPHAYSLSAQKAELKLDGVTVDRYACSTELSGSADSPWLDGIGTICHEFSHVLGLRDLYDTDYSENGQSADPGIWSIMAQGSYLNDGRTPAGYSFYERYALGFATPEPIAAAGDYQLNALGSSNKGYRINSSVDNEFFLLENRQNTSKWDQALPGHGMLVFRVDSTDAVAWERNKVNADSGHNYYELLRAGGTGVSAPNDPFPGALGVTALSNATSPANLLSWTGIPTTFALADISESGGVVSFKVADTTKPAVDPDGGGKKGCGMKYWFDDQPELAGQLSGIGTSLDIDVSQLSDGLHTLHVSVSSDLALTGYCEEAPRSIPFVKTGSHSKVVTQCYVDSVLQLNQTLLGVPDSHQLSVPVESFGEGMHRLTVCSAIGELDQTLISSAYFFRAATTAEQGTAQLVYSIDGAPPTTLQQPFKGGSLDYRLHVSQLSSGLHSLCYQVENSLSGRSTMPQTQFFLIDAQLKQYEYWLNDDRSTLTTVGLKTPLPYELAANLVLPTMPLRSHSFHFNVEEGIPVTYAVNDLMLRITDDGGCSVDTCVQYVDAKSCTAVGSDPLKENGTTQLSAPGANELKWYYLKAGRRDVLQLLASRPCTLQLFAPDGTEVYTVVGGSALEQADITAPLTGTYYLAVHDVSDGTAGGAVTLTYTHIAYSVPGDVDGDERVTMADVVAIMNFIVGRPNGIAKESADVNGDGVVNIADIMMVVGISLTAK